MKNIILVTGLSSAGKTTFSTMLRRIIPDSIHYNADDVRNIFNDWDFSEEGRIRQTLRMRELAEMSESSTVILDFICPLAKSRKIINPTLIFYINTISHSKYPDTDALYEPPSPEEGFKIVEINKLNIL